jgi:two-component system sensor histidine kinase RegB
MFPQESPRQNDNAWWLINLRWVAAVGQLITILAAAFVLKVQVPVVPLLIVVGVTAVTNAAIVVMLRRDVHWWLFVPSHREALLGVVALLDLLLLTELLYLSGGPVNPFSVFFFVNLGLSAMLLSRLWVWTLYGVAMFCLAALFLTHVDVALLQDPRRLRSIFSVGGVTYAHLGTFMAYATCSGVVIYFINRLTAALRQQEAALRHAQRIQLRSEKLEALGTLAAGTAHELATPLSTISVVAREVEMRLASLTESGQFQDAEVMEDISLISGELERCRAILKKMATDAGQAVGETIREVTTQELVAEILSDMPGRLCVQEVWQNDSVKQVAFTAPLHGLAIAFRGIVANAIDASPLDEEVRLEVSATEKLVRFEVVDFGEGMPPEVQRRAGDPFFTTKAPGSGMGLGLFLARNVIDRLGGTLQIASQPGEGTRVSIALRRAN